MIVNEELIRRIEHAESQRLRQCAIDSEHPFLVVGAGIAAFCGDGSAMTQCSGMNDEDAARHVDQVFDFYRGRCTEFEFKLSVIAQPELRSRVVEHARSLPEFETILVRDVPRDHPPVNRDLREVAADDAMAYAELSAKWFFSGEEPPPGIVDIIAASCVSPTVRTFIGYEGGEPVAGCSMNIAYGVAFMAGAAVEVAHRGRGWHQDMQAFRIAIASKIGCDLICQGALPGSISQQNAQKSGFEIAFTRPTFMVSP